MKKLILALVALFWMTVTTASAMSYEQARQQALFLTDKMAYELNLTDDQYEAAYEINLDYLMGVNSVDDLYGNYWRQRNLDLSYILLDWQYRSFVSASYFYRPLYWDAGYWHFGIYARYPRRDYFYFGRPNFYVSYRGGHSWRMNGGRSWYHGREWGGPRPGGQPRIGMRDGFNRGDFGRGRNFGSRQSSTRNTVTRDRQFGNNPGMDRRNNGQGMDKRNDRQNENRQFGNRSFGNNRQFSNSNDRPSRDFNKGNVERPSRDFGGNRSNSNRSNIFNGNRSFGGGNSSSTRSFTPRSSTSSPNLGGGSHMGGGSRGGNFGSGNRGGGNNGGGHFGNRR